jgi:hypothetical protein
MSNQLSDLGGRGLAAAIAALKIVRPARPTHPRGVSLTGQATVDGPADGGKSGISWLDTPARHDVTARFSRSIGLPALFPDILGLALRVPGQDGPADVLFASTGWSVPGRYVLLTKRDASNANLTTMIPYKGEYGGVLLGLQTLKLPRPDHTRADVDGDFKDSLADGEWILAMFYARPTGPWIRFGTLTLRAWPEPADTPVRFDPVLNTLPGASIYPWVNRVREPAYAVARKGGKRAADRHNLAAALTGQRSGDSAAADGAGEGTAEATSQLIPLRAKKRSNKMATVTRKFSASPQDVWNVLADGWLYPGWVVGASRIRDVDAEWPAPGSQLHHSVGTWPMLINDKTVSKSCRPRKSLEVIARGWPLGEAKVRITIEDGQDGGCTVSIAEDAIKGPGLAMPKFLRDHLITMRNRETLQRLELMAAGGAGRAASRGTL